MTIDRALTDEQLSDLVRSHPGAEYEGRLRYMRGDNATIVDRVFRDVTAPHANIPIPYGRKIIKTVTGYMYKPGLIRAVSDNEQFLEAINDLYWENDEDTKTAQLGEQVSLQGVGYEIHYMDGKKPRFVRVPAAGMIPVYSDDLEPELIACVRTIRANEDRINVEVYYPDRVDYLHYEQRQNQGLLYSNDIKFLFDRSEPHEYEAVPVCVFRNNDEMVGDFAPAVHLIDAYDRLMSDSVNEFDRFAWAYLVLKNMSMSKEDAAETKYKKIFEVMGDGGVEFLTKDVPHEFISFMAEWIRKEIHKQTHVPDFADDAVVSGGLSGVAMDRMLYDFEFVCSTKEMFFKDGLYQRMGLLQTVMKKVGLPTGDLRDIDFKFARNKVTSLIEQGEAMEKYAGHVSERTLVETFAPFVKDVDAEMEAVTEEKQKNAEAFGLGLMNESEEDPDSGDED